VGDGDDDGDGDGDDHASSNNHYAYDDVPPHRQSSDGELGDNATDSSVQKGGLVRDVMRHISLFRRKCGAFINHPWTQVFIVLLIVVNAIMIGIGTFDFVTENLRIDNIFQKVDRTFLIIFTIELVMQFVYRGFQLLLDGWLVFDLIIIVMSWAFESVQIIRAFRIFRALRLVTRIETLRDLVSSLFAVFPRLSAIGMLLLLVFYIFAVMTTTLFKDLPLSEDYFNNLAASLFTLFQFMTMEWSEVTREVMEYYSWAWAPFVIFVAISGFIVFNLIIAVICDAVAIIESEKHDDDERSVGGQTDGTRIDESTQKKIQDLNKQLTGLVFAQRQMQQQIDNLTREYYALQGIPLDGPDGETAA